MSGIKEDKYKFKQWFKNYFEYENEDTVVVIRDYDYRDTFTPEITEDGLEFLIIDGCDVEYFSKDELRRQGKIE